MVDEILKNDQVGKIEETPVKVNEFRRIVRVMASRWIVMIGICSRLDICYLSYFCAADRPL
jgi:hypothetical protein